MGRETVTFTVSIDEEVADDFRQFTQEKKGRIRGEMGRLAEKALLEYMDNDRYARIENKQDELIELVEGALSEGALERERNSNEVSNATTQSVTDKRLQAISADIPEHTAISEAMLETAIEENAGTAYKTKKKYKELLVKRGIVFEDPVDPDEFITSKRQLAIVCEQNPDVSAAHIDGILGTYDGVLEEDWYLEALPDAMIEGSELKYDTVDNLDSTQYRQQHGLDSDRRGFQ